ncbi:hypothetical protein [Rhodoplanes sp. SY1]|uniref:hypothetical protein n=1 Tax=Rhodoplanes sp. SY1 TaxID=3166646 RepID=UPI0038B49913
MPADAYTSLLGLLLQGTGNNDNTWGDNHNQYVTELIEDAIAEIHSVSTTGGSTTLTADQARCAAVSVTGALSSDATIVVPNSKKPWDFYNGTTGNFGVLVKTSSGTAVNVPRGAMTRIWCFGSNVVRRADAELVGTYVQHSGAVSPSFAFEADGAVKAAASFPDLFNKLVIQQSGAHTNGSAVITGLSDTSNMKAGYYVGGTGITDGSTIVSVDSSSQITINNTCTGSATSTVYVSPYGTVNANSFTLPDTKTAGRFLRSRTSSIHVGQVQADQNKQHNHTATATTTTTTSISTDGLHYHAAGIYDPGHSHSYTYSNLNNLSVTGPGVAANTGGGTTSTGASGTGVRVTSANGLDTTYSAGSHSHTGTSSSSTSVTVANDGGTEARPVALVAMTCIRY